MGFVIILSKTAKLLEPVVNVLDEEAGFAKITVTLDPLSTDEAYSTAISQTTEKLKQGGGSNLLLKADNNIVRIVGEQNIKNLCSSILYEKIKEECRKTNLPIAGNVRIEEFNAEGYQPGKPHAVTVHADLLPRITYDSEKGYFGLQIAVHMPNTTTKNHSTPLLKSIEMQKQFDEVKESIRYEHKYLLPTMSAHRSQPGDMIVATLNEYDYDPINQVRRTNLATTPRAEIHLLKDQCYPELMEQLLNITAPCQKAFPLFFPADLPDPAIANTTVFYEMEIKAIYKVVYPEWDDALAKTINPSLTLDELNASVMERIEEEAQEKNVLARIDALNFALLAVSNFSWIPDSLVQEYTTNVIKETCDKLKAEGYSKKEIDKMLEPENFKKFEFLLQNKTMQDVKLRLIYDDIITREQISLNATEQKEVANQCRIVINEFEREKRKKSKLVTENAEEKEDEQVIDEERVRETIERAMLQQKVVQLLLPTTDMAYIVDDPVEIVVNNNENTSSMDESIVTDPNNNVMDAEIVPS